MTITVETLVEAQDGSMGFGKILESILGDFARHVEATAR